MNFSIKLFLWLCHGTYLIISSGFKKANTSKSFVLANECARQFKTFYKMGKQVFCVSIFISCRRNSPTFIPCRQLMSKWGFLYTHEINDGVLTFFLQTEIDGLNFCKDAFSGVRQCNATSSFLVFTFSHYISKAEQRSSNSILAPGEDSRFTWICSGMHSSSGHLFWWCAL